MTNDRANQRLRAILVALFTLCAAIAISGCGGTKMLKEPEPLAATQSLATASDQGFVATLDWVIVRDGPGTWAENVDWDEYLIRVQNLSGDSIEITNITLLDSLGTRIESGEDRKQLVKSSKMTKRRYKGEGLKVRAGASAGVMRGVNNNRVNTIIESRQTLLPVTLAGEEETRLNVFYPLTPSPRQIELTYVDSRGGHTLVIDTQTALDGLHLVQAESDTQ